MRYLLDSDWVVDILKGKVPNPVLGAILLEGAATSILTYAEVYEGIYYGRRPAADLRALVGLLGGLSVLPITRPIARVAAVESGRLRAIGDPIPLPDLVIAATAMRRDLVLLTRNVRHYSRVSGLIHMSQPVPLGPGC